MIYLNVQVIWNVMGILVVICHIKQYMAIVQLLIVRLNFKMLLVSSFRMNIWTTTTGRLSTSFVLWGLIHHQIMVYKIFSKRFRFQLHYQNQQQLFTDRTGKSLKIESLATVGQLRTFLASMVKNFPSKKKPNFNLFK